MYRKRERHAPQEPLNLDFDTLVSLSDNMPAMSALFEKLAHGEHPDFRAIMTAISEMVAFYTDSDKNPVDRTENNFEMSQKKCRFCD